MDERWEAKETSPQIVGKAFLLLWVWGFKPAVYLIVQFQEIWLRWLDLMEALRIGCEEWKGTEYKREESDCR